MWTFLLSGDCKRVLIELNNILRATVNGNQKEQRKPWWDQLAAWQQEHPLAYTQEPEAQIKPQYLIDRLYELTADRDPIVSTDVGQHQMWAAQYFKLKNPRTWLTPGAWGTMGGFPAAMGAHAAFPDLVFPPPWVLKRRSLIGWCCVLQGMAVFK